MNPRRAAALDLLRLFACLLVIGRHAIPKVSDPGPFLAAWHACGWIGVDLFFTLSGWLIGGLLLNELRTTGKLRIGRFLFRRGLKIYPAYYALLAYTFARVFVGGGTDAVGKLLSDGWSCLILVQNYLGEHYPWGHTWSLAVEEHFYLGVPFLLTLAFGRGAFRGVVIACIGVATAAIVMRLFSSASASDVYTMTHYRIDALALGVAARSLAELGKLHLRRVPMLGIIATGLAPVAAAIVIPWDNPFMNTFGYTVNALCFCVLLVGLRREGVEQWINRIIPARLCASAGAMSYSIYLWHLNVVGWVNFHWLTTHAAAYVSVATVASISFGVLMAKAVEQPALLLRDARFTNAPH